MARSLHMMAVGATLLAATALQAEEVSFGELGQPLEVVADIEQVNFCDDCGCNDCDDCCSYDVCCGCGNSCSGCRYFDYRAGFDAWFSRLDDDDSNNFGIRQSVNGAIGLGSLPLRAQLGAAWGIYDLDGHEQGNTTEEESQVFVTAGLYHRANPACGSCWTYGFVWDYVNDDNLGEEHNQAVDLNQIRARLGYATSCCDEIGVWTAFSIDNQEANYVSLNIGPIDVNANDQVNLYWERWWPTGGRTMLYVGWADEPTEFLVGADGEVPLSSCVSLYGNGVYGKPSTSDGDLAPNGVEQSYSEAHWNVGFGFVYYFGGRPCSRADRPLFDVANNSTMMISTPVGGAL